MPRDRLDGIKTKSGRVVYDRKEHPFTAKDLERIGRKLVAEVQKPNAEPKIVWALIKVMQTITEELLAAILGPWGLAGLANEVREVLEDFISSILKVAEEFDFVDVPAGGDPGAGQVRF